MNNTKKETAKPAEKQKVRIEFDMEEYDYQAQDVDGYFIGDSYSYNGNSGAWNLEISVDGERLDENLVEDYNTVYTDYKKEVLSWDTEEEVLSLVMYVLNNTISMSSKQRILTLISWFSSMIVMIQSLKMQTFVKKIIVFLFCMMETN